jgi:hypothetical protein
VKYPAVKFIVSSDIPTRLPQILSELGVAPDPSVRKAAVDPTQVDLEVSPDPRDQPLPPTSADFPNMW